MLHLRVPAHIAALCVSRRRHQTDTTDRKRSHARELCKERTKARSAGYDSDRFLSFSTKDVRFKPNRRAAWLRFPDVRSSAWSI